MIDWWWSVLLTFLGCYGYWLTGNHNRVGWLINLSTEALWLTYALITNQWGFVFGAFFFGAVYYRNYVHWKE